MNATTIVLFSLIVLAGVCFDALMVETSSTYSKAFWHKDKLDFVFRFVIVAITWAVAAYRPAWLETILIVQLASSPVVWWVFHTTDKAEDRRTTDVVCRKVNRKIQRDLVG